MSGFQTAESEVKMLVFISIVRAFVGISLTVLAAVVILPIIAQVVKFVIKNPLEVVKAAVITAVGYIMLLGGMVIVDAIRQAF